MYDNPAIAVGAIAVSLGGFCACFYSLYHSAMIAVCHYRDTPPDRRANIALSYRTLPDTAKVHVRKAIKGMLVFFVCFLLMIAAARLLPN